MSSKDFFEGLCSTNPSAPTTQNRVCDCTRPDSTAGELTIIALSAISLVKCLWPQISWGWNALIRFSEGHFVRPRKRIELYYLN